MPVHRWLSITALALVCLITTPTMPARAASPEGTLTIGVHVTLVNRWLDPGETESLITPFMVLYALHDALVKPLPKNIMTPSLAESWTASKDGLTYDFVIRKNAKFHNGDPVTAEDVKFTFERYKGGSAKILKDHVKEIQTPSPNQVRFVLKEPWPDFMAFYGTSATGASWIVPKKYIEKVGEDGFKKAPVGAGPYKFVSFSPGVELVLEAFPQYWRKAPSVKRLVMRSIPDETTRAAAVKTGEADLAYLFTGPAAEELKRSPGVRIVAPILYGMYWLDFPDQWDPKSPWHDKRVRMAANLAIDRKGINQSEMLGMGKLASSNVPPEFDFALKLEPPAYDPKRAKQLMTEAGYANGFDAGDLTPLPPYTTLAESVASMLQTIGIRSHVRSMERATFLAAWRERSCTVSSSRPPAPPATPPLALSPSSRKTASMRMARCRRSTISSSVRPRSSIASSARRTCTRSRRSSRTTCSSPRSSSRPSSGAWARASPSRRPGSSKAIRTSGRPKT